MKIHININNKKRDFIKLLPAIKKYVEYFFLLTAQYLKNLVFYMVKIKNWIPNNNK